MSNPPNGINNRWPVNSTSNPINVTYMDASGEFICTTMGQPGAQPFRTAVWFEMLPVVKDDLPEIIFSLNSLDGKVIEAVTIDYNSEHLEIIAAGTTGGKDGNFTPDQYGIVKVQVKVIEPLKEGQGDTLEFSMKCVKPDGSKVNFDPKVYVGKPTGH